MADIEMPQLGETVTEGTITQWFKSVGDDVAEDEPLFEVSTDKVDSEVPSPVSGTLTEIIVQEGDTVDVGTVLARIGDGDGGGGAPATAEKAAEGAEAGQADQQEPPPEPDVVPEEQEPAPQEPEPAPAAETEQEAARPQTPEPADEEARAEADAAPAAETEGGGDRGRLLSPVVRRLISENDLDPESIEGTGAGGRITRSDVQKVIEAGAQRAPAAKEAPAQKPAPAAKEAPSRPAPQPRQVARAGERDTAVPHSNIRKRTAEHMRRSLDTSAHVYASIEVDFENVERVRRAHKDAFRAEEGFGLTYLPFITRAVVDAIREWPEVNASFGENELIVHNYVNLGVAVDLDFQGLLAPVVTDADAKRLRAIAREVADLAERARSKQLSPDELADGTFTITNPGPFGTTMTMPIINQPQVAILSTDGVKRKPVVVTGDDGTESIGIHGVGNLTLTWDHRAFDGAYAASFLKECKDNLETMDWEQELG